MSYMSLVLYRNRSAWEVDLDYHDLKTIRFDAIPRNTF